MAKYWRWRKQEGQWPKWGPYMVVRKQPELEDWFTRLPFEREQVELTIQFGFYVVNYLHFQWIYNFRYDRMYWETF